MKFDIETKSGYFLKVYDDEGVSNLNQIKILHFSELILSHSIEDHPKYSELEAVIRGSLYAPCGHSALVAVVENLKFFPIEWFPERFIVVPFVGTRLKCVKRKIEGAGHIAVGREYFPALRYGTQARKWGRVFVWTEETEIMRGNYHIAAYIP
jgi:hypothetical protein